MTSHRAKRPVRRAGKEPESSDPSVRYDGLLFWDDSCKDWYTEHLNNSFVYECRVEKKLDKALKITEKFRARGLGTALTYGGFRYCEKSVLQFYANIKDKKGCVGRTAFEPYIETYVGNKAFTITRSDINNFYGITPGSASYKMKNKDISVKVGNSTIVPTRDMVLEKLGTHGRRVKQGKNANPDSVKKPEVYIDRDYCSPFVIVGQEVMTRNIIPRSSNQNRMRVAEGFLLAELENPDSWFDWVDIGTIVIENMWQVVCHRTDKKAIVYPILISALVQSKQINLINPTKPADAFIITYDAMMKKHKNRVILDSNSNEYINVDREIRNQHYWNGQRCTSEEFVAMGGFAPNDDEGEVNQSEWGPRDPRSFAELGEQNTYYHNEHMYQMDMGFFRQSTWLAQGFAQLNVGMQVPPMTRQQVDPPRWMVAPPQAGEGGSNQAYGDDDDDDEENDGDDAFEDYEFTM